MKLYDFTLAPNPRRVRMFLAEKDIEVLMEQINTRDGSQFSDAFLAINPRGDAPACLILMSVSKDVERAGDYCKNLLEVAEMLKTPAQETKYADDLREIADQVASSFAGWTVMVTVATFEPSRPSLAVYVKLSLPLKFAFGV